MISERRDFVQNALGAAALLATGISTQDVEAEDEVASSESGLPPPSAHVHVLNRTSFGIGRGDLVSIQRLGIPAYLDRQMNWQSIADPVCDALLRELTPTIFMSNAELLAAEQEQEQKGQVPRQLKAATLIRAIFSKRQLYEVMVEFWSDHFSIFHRDEGVLILKTADDRDVIRQHALGNFKELLRASSKSPAMLVYLDNYTNVAGTPNENYARELMELHTLGVDGGYSEEDVREVARCLTGWGVSRLFRSLQPGVFIFDPEHHDDGEKTVLGTVIAAGGGIKDGETVIDMLADHPSTAHFIATKLVRRFVADEPPADLVDRVADVYADTDGDIQSMLREIFSSDEFMGAFDEKFKRPINYVVSALRVLDVEFESNLDRAITEYLSSLGQVPFEWVPPNGYPDLASYWASSNGMLTRWNFALELSSQRLRGLGFDYIGLLGKVWKPYPLVDSLASNLLHRQLAAADRDMFAEYLANGFPADELLGFDAVSARVPTLIGIMLSSDYFQYR